MVNNKNFNDFENWGKTELLDDENAITALSSLVLCHVWEKITVTFKSNLIDDLEFSGNDFRQKFFDSLSEIELSEIDIIDLSKQIGYKEFIVFRFQNIISFNKPANWLAQCDRITTY